MEFCFIHAADLHLDSPFEGIGEVSPDLAERLRDASLKALENLVRLTIERRAVFLLLAGDIYDGAERGIRAQFRFLDAMKTLAAAGVPVFIVHGNHDPIDGWKAIRQWPDNVTIFPSGRVESKTVVRDGGALATIYGTSYPVRDVSTNLTTLFVRKPSDGLHIGLLHCNVGGVPEHDRYCPCSPYDLARADFHYWALGHIHTRRVFQAGAAWAAYPGNTQGRSFKPSEQGAKGALVVTANGAGVHELHFEPIDCVRFAEIGVDIAGLEDWAALASALERQAATAQEKAEGRDLVLRATLTGRGSMHADLRQPERLQELLKEMRLRSADNLDRVHWSAIENATSPDFDRDSIRGRGDFAAELVARADALFADETAQAGFVANAWSHSKAHQLSRWLSDPDDAERTEILRQAERKALELTLDCIERETE